MNVQELLLKAKEYIAFLKTHSFGDKIMKKRTISSLEKLIIFSAISVFSFIVMIGVIFVPSLEQLRSLQAEKQNILTLIYGKVGEKEGALYVNQKKKQLLEEEEQKFREARVIELDKYNQALLQDDLIYDVAIFLEDYAVTFNSEEKPFVINNISFGKKSNVNIPANMLKQKQEFTTKISIPAEYKILPMTVSIEGHKENFEQFLDFVYHSGDIKQYYFKGKPVPMMSIESLSLPVDVTDDNPVNTYSLKLNFYFQKEAKTPSAKKL